ncbi:MAG: cation transporter [Treponema sp.]|jgi:divalent metal cation (Fe/Co/Zn/Cd) transporter|nr:cation transporter [Treponema sp.]
MSSPGPIVVGIGLLLGRSSTQLADFIRRTAELAAIIISWIVFRITAKAGAEDAAHKARLEGMANLGVGAAMCLSGAVMLLIVFLSPEAEKGNVIPGLVIAILGVSANTWFWLRYRKLDRARPNAILAVQSRLYRAKSLVDACVTLALGVVAIAPASRAAHYMDIGGSVAVAVYLILSGAMTLRGKPAKGNT